LQITNFYAPANNITTTILKGTFSGKVTDAKTGKVVTGASIYITDIKAGTSSDNDGNFIFKNIPEGNHLVEVSHIGYTTTVENVVISGDTKK